jgi:hypothetical protein
MLRLREALAEYKPYILGFFRSPIDFLVSRYRHEVTNGSETRALRHFLTDVDNILSANFHSRTLVWNQFFETRTVFRNYSRDDIRNDIVGSFLECVGLAHIDRTGFISIEDVEEEIKLSPSLIDAVRTIKTSDLGNEMSLQAFDYVFKLSKILGHHGIDKFISEAGLTEETYRLIGSLQLDSIDQSRILPLLELDHARIRH